MSAAGSNHMETQLNTHFSALLHRREAESRQRVEAEWDAWQKQQATQQETARARWRVFDASGTEMISALAASIGARAGPVASARPNTDGRGSVSSSSSVTSVRAPAASNVSVAERIARLSARRSDVLTRSPGIADQRMSPYSRPPSTASQLSADLSSQHEHGRSSSGGGDVSGSDEGSLSRSAGNCITATAAASIQLVASSRVESFRKLVRMSPEQQTAKLLTRAERDLPLVAPRLNHINKGGMTTTAAAAAFPTTKTPPLRR